MALFRRTLSDWWDLSTDTLYARHISIKMPFVLHNIFCFLFSLGFLLSGRMFMTDQLEPHATHCRMTNQAVSSEMV